MNGDDDLLAVAEAVGVVREPAAPGWRKSRRSMANGQCIEVAVWRKSRRSGSNPYGNCVQVAVVTTP